MFRRAALSALVLLALPASAAAVPVAPAGVELGDAFVDGSGPTVWVPITTDTLPTSGITVSINDEENFALGENLCVGVSLTAPPDTCFIGVRLTPQSAGPHSAGMTISAISGGNDGVTLTGRGVVPGTGPTGPPGDDGAPGGPGATGPGGAQGPAGAQGIPGRAIQATCTTKGKPPKTSCRIVILPDDVAATALRVRLVRAGKTFARGSARREGTVRLKTLRRVKPGRYTVAISFAVDGRRVSGRQVVRVR